MIFRCWKCIHPPFMLSCIMMHDACLFESGSCAKHQNALGQSAWPELMLPRNRLTSKSNNDPSYESANTAQKSTALLSVWVKFVEPVRHFEITLSCHTKRQSASKTQVRSQFVLFWWVSMLWDLSHFCVSLWSLMLLLWFLSPITISFEARCHLCISSRRASSFVCSSVIAWAWTSAPRAKQDARMGAMAFVAPLKHGPTWYLFEAPSTERQVFNSLFFLA